MNISTKLGKLMSAQYNAVIAIDHCFVKKKKLHFNVLGKCFKKGDALNLSNYREISVVNVAAKVFASVLLNQLKEYIIAIKSL